MQSRMQGIVFTTTDMTRDRSVTLPGTLKVHFQDHILRLYYNMTNITILRGLNNCPLQGYSALNL